MERARNSEILIEILQAIREVGESQRELLHAIRNISSRGSDMNTQSSVKEQALLEMVMLISPCVSVLTYTDTFLTLQ